MLTPLNSGTVLLVELLRGPGYGLDLIDRVRDHSNGRIQLRHGAVYPALRDLGRRKLVRRWNVLTPGSGRPRTYYELTEGGLALARSHRESIAGFVAETVPPLPEPRELDDMKKRLFACAEASAAGTWLRSAGKRVRR